MLAFIELLDWLAQIAMLDLKRLTPAGRVTIVIFYGLLGVLFLCAGVVSLFDDSRELWKMIGGVVVALLGLGLLARLAYGLVELRRLSREHN